MGWAARARPGAALLAVLSLLYPACQVVSDLSVPECTVCGTLYRMKYGQASAEVHSGSSFDDFLEEEGIREEVESAAIKRVLAWQFEQEMERQHKTKRAMAAELKTSRSQLDRLLDPQNTAVSLDTLTRAAHVLGKRLVLEVRDIKPPKVAKRGVGHL